MRAVVAALLALAAAAGTSGAQPRSAIPWLSDSIATPPPPQAPRARPRLPETPEAATITVTALPPISRDAVGVLAPEVTGLPRALWGPASALRARAQILGHTDRGAPAARALFRRLLLAEADPPSGAGPAAGVLLARIDRLLDLGALDEAEALLVAAGPETPELFRRWFDVGVLTQNAAAQCAALRENPALSPTLPARVFCLARGGDWNAAEITLTLGREVGSISPDQMALLARFLDPVLFEADPEPPIPDPLTALDFTLREAVALPRPTGLLPLAFLWADLDEHAPMRMRINAAERLALAGSASPATLFGAYRAGAPAASGGVWDRARVVQTLDGALTADDATALAAALAAADAALTDRGLRVSFAEEYAPALAAIDPATLPEGARPGLAELLLLAGDAPAAARAAGRAPDARLASLLAVAGSTEATPPRPEDPLTRAALSGLSDRPARGERETLLATTLARGETAQAILDALALVEAGPSVDPGALEAALFGLRAAGQGTVARAIALQTLLLPNGT